MLSTRSTVHVRTRPNLEGLLLDRPEVNNFTAMQARLIQFYARKHFLAVVKHTHPVTPPAYSESFFIRSRQENHRRVYSVGNDDPVAVLVEFGAHPRGGPTEVLGYRPLGHGVDAVANGGG